MEFYEAVNCLSRTKCEKCGRKLLIGDIQNKRVFACCSYSRKDGHTNNWFAWRGDVPKNQWRVE